jgi:hypothetical protein
MHWHIYLVLAVGGLCLLILDLALGLWARASMALLMMASMGLAAWNGREDERKARAAALDADTPDATRE